MTWLKQQFAADPVAASDLSRFEENPKVFAPSLQATIEKKAHSDPAFSAAIAERVKELGPMITVIQEFNDARNLTGVDGAVHSGQVSVTQKGNTASDVTGIKGT